MVAEHWYGMTGSNPVLGRIALVAVAVAVVGAFTVLQIRAWSRPAARRARAGRAGRPGRGRRARGVADWRTLPPPYSAGAGEEEVPVSGHDDYGPLWRYGAPRGYGHRDDRLAHHRADGAGHNDGAGRADGAGRSAEPGAGTGRSPGYPPGSWPPRGTPAPYEGPRDWGS